MATADKLTYLNETKQKIKEAINNTQIEEITDEPFRQYADKIKSAQDKYERYLQKVVITEKGSDNTLNLNDALDYNILNLEIDGNSEQVQTTGSNILPILNLGIYWEYTENGIKNKSYNNGKITEINLKANKKYNIMFKLLTPKTSNTSFTGYIDDVEKTNLIFTNFNRFPNQLQTITYTPAKDETLSYRMWGNESPTEEFEFQLWCNEDEIKDYEPYTGGQPSPSPNYPQEVKCVEGIRNLFDKDNAKFGTISQTDGVTISPNEVTKYSDYMNVIPNKNYVFSSESNNLAVRLFKYRNDKSYIGNEVLSVNTKYTNYIVPTDVYYIRIQASPTFTDNQFMIKENSADNSYIPYGSWLKTEISGKNLFESYNNWTTTVVSSGVPTQSSIAISIKDNTNNSITFSKNGNSYSGVYSKLINLKANKTYMLSFKTDYIGQNGEIYANLSKYENNAWTRVVNIGSIQSGKEITTQYTPKNDENIALIIYASASYNYDNVNIYDIQIEQGTQATGYQPYFPPKEILIPLNKKNLCPNDWEGGTYNSSTGDKEEAKSRVRVPYLVEVQPGSTLYFDTFYTKTCNFIIRTYDKNKVFVRNIGGVENNSTRKLENDEYYIGIVIYDDSLTIQTSEEFLNLIANGTIKPTICYDNMESYELCKIGDIYDTLNVDMYGNVEVEKKIGKIVLDGSESWLITATESMPYFILSDSVAPIDTIYIPHILCNYYMPGKRAGLSAGQIGLSGQKALIIYDSRYKNDLDGWKIHLKELYDNGNPVVVYYELLNPGTQDLDSIQPISLNEGDNKIQLTTDDIPTTLEGEYIADGVKAIKRKKTPQNSTSTLLPSTDATLVMPSIDTMPVEDKVEMETPIETPMIEEQIEVAPEVEVLPNKEVTKINRSAWLNEE